MPELPEVETIKNDARATLVGRKIVGYADADLSVVRETAAGELARTVGLAVVDARRGGKYLLIDLEDDTLIALQLVIYGQLLLVRPEDARPAGLRLVLNLDDGAQIRLIDESGYARATIGRRDAVEDAIGLSKLGPEPLEEGFTLDVFRAILGARRARIKSILLDQHEIAGLGNIYVDEALFLAKIHPERAASSLGPEEVGALHESIRAVLRAGIEHRGTTFNTFRDLFGRPGGHQEHLMVFQRTGKPCRICGTRIVRSTVASRLTYVCPRCQAKG